MACMYNVFGGTLINQSINHQPINLTIAATVVATVALINCCNLDCCNLVIYLLCKSYQGTRKIMQNKNKKNTERKKNIQKTYKTPQSHTVHTQFTIVCTSDLGNQQDSAA